MAAALEVAGALTWGATEEMRRAGVLLLRLPPLHRRLSRTFEANEEDGVGVVEWAWGDLVWEGRGVVGEEAWEVAVWVAEWALGGVGGEVIKRRRSLCFPKRRRRRWGG